MKDFLPAVLREFDSASQTHGQFASCHEGYAVILEEMDELWEEIKRNPRSNSRVRDEVIQVAAMALRFLADCVED